MNLGAAFCASPPVGPFDLSARHEDGEIGIPAYKISMIDGWIVRSDEITEALAVIEADKKQDRDPDPDWKRWVDFLRDAARGQGFLVE